MYSTLYGMDTRTFVSSDRLMPAAGSACAKQDWSGAEHNQLPTYAPIATGRSEAAL